MNIKHIVEGWKNLVFTDEEIEKLSEERMSVCNECPHKEINILNLDVCAMCHCPLEAKTRSPKSICPKEKWQK